MPNPSAVPDAWDEDWETLADKPETENTKPSGVLLLTKAERKAKHAEQNRAVWESAENPEPMLFLQARDNGPVQSSFKPNVTVLSRKPPPRVLVRNDGSAAMAGLTLDDDDDSEEERRKHAEQSYAERKARAEKEREEKIRKYAEAREKIFGSPAPSSGESRGASPSKSSRGRTRGRGGRDGSLRSSAEQSPVRPAPSGKQLYEPSYSPKPTSTFVQKRESNTSRSSPSNGVQQPIREPRGPSGRGFAPRGRSTKSTP
ncbi:hypothetical protein BU24DRAFT_104792 [Aaosphaeria arxii CBS 175.79]|uniref:SUZ domain-containing protein n=1 Tax=Aaosphaeria arxii CBS 175.79 TaxID=1450172 RepID=A0A6A5Y0I0_9PLEO|nr:uncharacterized protein BU24DRAFT_104792 [Aaosphaeria arxii CBS 175.79]KAF2018769.1 hypothetical protein BU24DRAFT_104792 [Aaosphaeria arxii CBS 175.79]